MQAVAETGLMLALGGWEMILILAVVMILFGAKRLPDFPKGLRRGIFLFWDETKRTTHAIDEAASDAGRSAGGIYGKAAVQALTPDNHVAELYDPSALKNKGRSRKPSKAMVTAMKLLSWMRRLVRAIRGVG